MARLFQPNFRSQCDKAIELLLKKRTYDLDLLTPQSLKKLDSALEELAQLKKSTHSKENGAEEYQKIYARYSDLLYQGADAGWRENVEVFFVALVIALGIRAYFLQPFKIPTHSMFPSLYGIYLQPQEIEPPHPLRRMVDRVIFGISYHYVKASEDGQVLDVVEMRKPWSPFLQAWIETSNRSYPTGLSLQQLHELDAIPPLGKTFTKGEVLLNATKQSGDHLFVNKMKYHFMDVSRGEVFVFTTRGIEGIERTLRAQRIQGSQYYIKRCVGVPHDELQITPPHLWINGQPTPEHSMMHRVELSKDGYRGYVFGELYLTDAMDTYRLPAERYWAMGDNSANSFDSRGWGAVSRENLVGSALAVYWPLGKRWGWIR